MTTSPLGYGDTNHLDAVTSAPTYTASYDAAGSMTGRNGQVLGYDALRRLITWQNQATSPTQKASYAYNDNWERVQQSVTSSGTTTTNYIGSYEEVSVTGSTTTTTKYYSAGLATVVNVNGTLSYLVGDTLGSVSASLTAAGGTQATELYTPYGSVRYSSGTMPTSYGYTKQRQDPSGLNYDHARYYDASVGQFISADSVQGPNRYGYVAGNPETNTDPTGNLIADQGNDDGYCGVCTHPIHVTPPPPPPPTTPTQPTTSHPTGGGGDGNPTCIDHGGAADPCATWEERAIKARSNDRNLKVLYSNFVNNLLVGGILVAVADIINFINDHNILSKAEDIVDFFTLFMESIVPALGWVAENEFPGIKGAYQDALNIVGPAHKLLAAFQGFIGIYKSASSFQKWLMSTSGTVITNAAGAIMGPMDLIKQSVLSLVGGGLDVGGHLLLSSSSDDYAQYQKQMNMNIFDWCAENAGECAPVPQS